MGTRLSGLTTLHPSAALPSVFDNDASAVFCDGPGEVGIVLGTYREHVVARIMDQIFLGRIMKPFCHRWKSSTYVFKTSKTLLSLVPSRL